MPSPQEFAASIKAKYPQYAEMPDDELVTRILDKHPVYRDRITPPEPQPAQATTPEAPQSMGLGEMASSAVGNLPGSALQFAKDVTAPIHSPIETAKGLGGLAAGVVQNRVREAKNFALGSDDAPGENEQKLEALVSFIGERYGGLEEHQAHRSRRSSWFPCRCCWTRHGWRGIGCEGGWDGWQVGIAGKEGRSSWPCNRPG